MSQRTLVSAMYQETNRYTALAKNISDISQPVKSGKRITGEVLRNKIHAIEDACWNESDFWMPRDVTQIRVGIMGASGLSRQKIMDSICNGNSLKADQGRRYKKIVSIEDHPFLIIFREEVAEPTEEFIRWVDVFILITDSAGSIVIAKKYMNMFSKTSSLESAVGVLAAVKTPAKSKRRTFKTEDFFKIDSSNLFKHVEVNLEDETSLNSLLTTACASHIERRRKKPVPTPVSSTRACTEETHTPNFFASPIAVARPTKSRPKVSKLINPTPNPVAVSSSVNAVIETPVTANLMDGFKTPGQSTASTTGVYLPSTTTHQLRTTTRSQTLLSQSTSDQSGKAAKKRGVRFELTENQQTKRSKKEDVTRSTTSSNTMQTPLIAKSPHVAINIQPQAAVFTPSTSKSPHVTICIDSE